MSRIKSDSADRQQAGSGTDLVPKVVGRPS